MDYVATGLAGFKGSDLSLAALALARATIKRIGEADSLRLGDEALAQRRLSNVDGLRTNERQNRSANFGA